MAVLTYGWPPADVYCERCTEANPGSGRAAFHAPPDCYTTMWEIEAKKNYACSRRQTRRHSCHWPGCEAQVPPALWGCKRHWLRLPKWLRDKVWAAYSPGQEERMDPSDTYLTVAQEVEHWIMKQGGA